MVKVAGSIVFLAVLIVYLSRRKRLHLPFSRLIGSNPDLMPLAGLAFCFGTAAITGLLGLSLAYGAFLAGLIVGNSTARRVMMRHTAPIQTVLLMIFFLSIGLLIDMRYIWDNIWTVLVILLFITVCKTALNIGAIRLLGESWPRAFLSGVLLAQIGEFSFVLAALGLAVGAVDHEAQRLIVALTVLSLMFGPLWLLSARRFHNILLLGVTSARETLRLAYGKEAAFLFRPITPSASVVDVASKTRWMGDDVPSAAQRAIGDPVPDFALETAHGAADGRVVIGLDEVGRGPWAGPVTAAAVWLAPERLTPAFRAALDDSKTLTRARRDGIFEDMSALAASDDAPLRLALGEASVEEIDRLNILQASLLAMARAASALAALGLRPDAALVDGTHAPSLECPVTTVVGGDRKCLTIAAASIAAKVTRDRLMARLSEAHPGYGWERNAGYGTQAHRDGLQRLGVSPHHRRSFKPIREALRAG